MRRTDRPSLTVGVMASERDGYKAAAQEATEGATVS